ncbi:MAG: TOBE domain-containing protein, partial [Candidatus Nanopelagicales bacterium]
GAPGTPSASAMAGDLIEIDGLVKRYGTVAALDGVMALVEIQAGPHRVVSLMSREAADELGLEPGVRAAASIKATNVVVELDR